MCFPIYNMSDFIIKNTIIKHLTSKLNKNLFFFFLITTFSNIKTALYIFNMKLLKLFEFPVPTLKYSALSSVSL